MKDHSDGDGGGGGLLGLHRFHFCGTNRNRDHPDETGLPAAG